MFTAAATRAKKINMETDAECKLKESWCALCMERFRARYTHPSQWSRELQQFLHHYSSIDMTSRVSFRGGGRGGRGGRHSFPLARVSPPPWELGWPKN